jgi:cell wall-associated NlpC family hydrolase
MSGEINGKAMAAISVGMLMVWSGIKGWSLAGVIGDVITGQQPVQENTQPVGSTGYPDTLNRGGPGTGGVSMIPHAALQYLGHAYLFGGAPGKDGSQPWDCSSYTNYVCAVKCGLPIPGYKAGKYDGTSHGPPSGAWAVWTGLRNVSASEVQAGDIIIWGGHIGMALNNTQMISALNPKTTTKVTQIEGTGRGPIIRRGRYI